MIGTRVRFRGRRVTAQLGGLSRSGLIGGGGNSVTRRAAAQIYRRQASPLAACRDRLRSAESRSQPTPSSVRSATGGGATLRWPARSSSRSAGACNLARLDRGQGLRRQSCCFPVGALMAAAIGVTMLLRKSAERRRTSRRSAAARHDDSGRKLVALTGSAVESAAFSKAFPGSAAAFHDRCRA